MSVAEFRTTEVEMSISYRNQLRYVLIRTRRKHVMVVESGIY